MRRLFFSLYAVIAAALVGFILLTPWLLENVLRGELLRSAEETAAVAQFLFEEEFRQIPRAQWPTHAQSLKSKFGYDLDLLRLGEIDEPDAVMQRLRRGLAGLPDVTDEQEDIAYMLLPIRGSDYVVRAYLEQQQREHAQRTVEGFYYLLEKQLAPHSDAELAGILSGIERRFGIPVRVVSFDAVPAADRQRLRAGEVVGYDVDKLSEHYFKRRAQGDAVLQIGPFPHYFLEVTVEYLLYVLLAIVVAGAIYLWVRPLWRDMLELDRGAAAIGGGELRARVEVSARSPVRALADSFNTMAQRVQELLKAQKETADAMSHELRTPIARLRFGIEMLGRAPSEWDYQRYMSGILRDLQALDDLVDEALTYSRLTNSTARLSMQEVELTDWLREIMQDTQRSAGATRVSSEITTASATASFDAQLMARALGNVINNSLRYARSTVKVTISEDEGHLDMTVEDDGPGVPPEQREAIFEPFYRIDPSRQRASGGHGLGLAIVKRICEWHRAQVTVAESALGGALFKLRLPML